MIARELKGVEKMIEFDSKALGAKRKLKIYTPPGHDPGKSYPVMYAADGMTNGEVLEPVIIAGRLRPLVVVGVLSGGYRGDLSKPYKTENDLRALEYVPGLDADHFAKHEKFFCDEVRAWAEKELGASKVREDRAVQGVSNGARFAVEMGVRHPELFGHVLGFSVASRTPSSIELSAKTPALPRFHLAAGKWEPEFFKTTAAWADRLKMWNVPVVFVPRVSGHDDAMWREELIAAMLQAFGTRPARSARVIPRSLLGSWQDREDPSRVIHFEQAKCIFARVGAADPPQFVRAACEPGKIVTHSWAQKQEYNYELKDQILSLTELPAGTTKTYRKLDEAPAEVQVKPLKTREASAVPGARVPRHPGRARKTRQARPGRAQRSCDRHRSIQAGKDGDRRR